MDMSRDCRNGFTLIELLVVIAKTSVTDPKYSVWTRQLEQDGLGITSETTFT